MFAYLIRCTGGYDVINSLKCRLPCQHFLDLQNSNFFICWWIFIIFFHQYAQLNRLFIFGCFFIWCGFSFKCRTFINVLILQPAKTNHPVNPQLIGQHHAKTCLLAYADSEGPDQPAHPCSPSRVFTVCLQNHSMLQNVSMESKGQDDALWVHRMIWILHFVHVWKHFFAWCGQINVYALGFIHSARFNMVSANRKETD